MFSDLKASQWTEDEVFALIRRWRPKKDEFDNPTIKKVNFEIELQRSWILKDLTNLQPCARKSGTIWKFGIFNCLMLFKSENHYNIEMFMIPHVVRVQSFELYVCKSVGHSWFYGSTTHRKLLRSFQNE